MNRKTQYAMVLYVFYQGVYVSLIPYYATISEHLINQGAT